MLKIGTSGQNDRWQYNIGKYGCGACVHYKAQANFGAAGTLWDPNGWELETKVNGTKPLGWAGSVSQSPPDGSLNSMNVLNVSVLSTPIGAAISASVIFSTNGGTNWSSARIASCWHQRH